MGTHVYDRASDLSRLVALQGWLDPKTTDRLMQLGVAPGWCCLEVGAGAGSIASWLAERAGPPRTSGRHRRRHAVPRGSPRARRGPPPRHHRRAIEEGGFDLVHTRAVLAHLPARHAVLPRLVAALRPGGRLVVEDVDFQLPISTAPSARFVLPADASPPMAAAMRAVATVMATAGVDPEYGRHLPARLIGAGLVDVPAMAESELVRGGSMPARVFRGTLEQLWDQILGTGALDEHDLNRLVALFDAREFACMSPALVAAGDGARRSSSRASSDVGEPPDRTHQSDAAARVQDGVGPGLLHLLRRWGLGVARRAPCRRR